MKITICSFVLLISFYIIPLNSNAYDYIGEKGIVKNIPINKNTKINDKIKFRTAVINKEGLRPRTVSEKCFDRRLYQRDVNAISARYGVDARLVNAIIATESCFYPRAVSPKGAQGLMQLMPFTAKRFGVTDSFNIKQNINGGVKYIQYLLKYFHGDIVRTVAAYNAGEGAVGHYNGVPPYIETKNYVRKVMGLYGKKTYQNSLDKLTRQAKQKNNCIATRQIRSYTYLEVSEGSLRRYYIPNSSDSYLGVSKKTGVGLEVMRKLNEGNSNNNPMVWLIWECKLK